MEYTNPHAWDDLWEHEEPAQIVAKLARARRAHPDWHARYTHALAAAGQVDEALDQIDTALDIYQGQPGMSVDLLRAVRLQVLNACGRYLDVQHDAREIYGNTPALLEAGCLTQYALGYACLYLGQHSAAMLHTGQALALANALELPHRRRVTQLLWSHLLSALGQVAPREVLFGIARSVHRSTARHGAMRIVESHLYAGEYHLAAEFAQRRGLSGMERGARAFMGERALPGQEAGPEDAWWQELITGIRAACDLRHADIPVLESDATALGTYARLLNALRSLKAGSRTNFESLLGPEPGQPDQRAYWACLRLAASLESALDASPTQLCLAASEALLAVPFPAYVMRAVENMLPRTVLLLSHAPDSRLRPLLSGLTTPLLLDGYVTNHQRITVAPAVAEHLICQSLGIKSVINGGYLSKYRSRLKRHGISQDRVVNIADLYLDAEVIRRGATGGLGEAWDGVLLRLRRASPLLTRSLESR